MKVLVVINPFQGKERGAVIDNPNEMTAVLSGEYAQHVVSADHDVKLKTPVKE